MPLRSGPADCDNCGDRFRGAGKLCPDCVPLVDPPGRGRRPMCRFCKGELSWDSVRRVIRTVENASVECLYYCGHCGGVQEFATWAQAP